MAALAGDSGGEIARLGNAVYILVSTDYYRLFPSMREGANFGPTWIESTGAVAFCSVSQLHARRHQVATPSIAMAATALTSVA
jgi:hypothetical protein